MEYDYIIEKPELNEDTLTHFGIKGMKWRKRKADKKAQKRNEKYVANKMADDIESGRRHLHKGVAPGGDITKDGTYIPTVDRYKNYYNLSISRTKTNKNGFGSLETDRYTESRKLDKAIKAAR